ncbi:MAG: L-threonylcarbamoyladenylate synthase [Bdellovibrio sp.]|jgi:L-threonylcarbamoyladenylate synthase
MSPLEKAVLILDQGGVVGMPTETVYGLAARIDREDGLQAIFLTKKRPFFDPLIVHVSSIEQAQNLTTAWGPTAQALAETFWPGPLTLVLPKSSKVSALITSGLTTVGLRFPNHPIARALIEQAGAPLAAPSANLFGRTSPTKAVHVESEFAGQVFVLEGGDSEVGIESTIVAILKEGELRLLRPGVITTDVINESLKQKKIKITWSEVTEQVTAPGQLKHHYMPAKPLILIKEKMSEEAFCKTVQARLQELPAEVEGVKLSRPSSVTSVRWLSLSAEPLLAARQLYQVLRDSAQTQDDVLALVWPNERRTGVWTAVWDRLGKAASLDL